jgi:hypothetical protein
MQCSQYLWNLASIVLLEAVAVSMEKADGIYSGIPQPIADRTQDKSRSNQITAAEKSLTRL